VHLNKPCLCQIYEKCICHRLKNAGADQSRLRVLADSLQRAINRYGFEPDPAEVGYVSRHHWKRRCGMVPDDAPCPPLNDADEKQQQAPVSAEEDPVRVATAWLDESRAPHASAWPATKKQFLVFTSAGDNNNVAKWVEPEGSRNFELCVVYYGDESDPPCLSFADHALRIKGGKFPNLLAAAKRQLHYFTAFEAILVADDDVIIDAEAISKLFLARRELDVWVMAPANSAAGKADIAGLRAQDGFSHRFVNFIEVTTPLFRTDKLMTFLREYSPQAGDEAQLVGYGLDEWFCQVIIGVDDEGQVLHADKAAVIDCIQFTNPHDSNKSDGREIDRLRPYTQRQKEWRAMALQRGVHDWYPFRTLSRHGELKKGSPELPLPEGQVDVGRGSSAPWE
jgi:hypothetical protein